MKLLRVSDDDYMALAKLLAINDTELFERVCVAKPKRNPREHAVISEDAEGYFNAAWEGWPTTVNGKWLAGIGYEKRVVLKGSRKIALENFKTMLAQATPRELYVASVAYLTMAPSVKEGFIQNVSTFYGPQKATVLEWLDKARELIKEQDEL